MTIQATLQAEHRTVTGKAVRQLRRQGILPANLTGRHIEPLVIQVKASDVNQLLMAHGRTTVIRLSIPPEAEPITVMIGHVQREPVGGAIEHVDFLQVVMVEKMRAHIALRAIGVAPAVANNVGILLQLVTQIEVEALPDDLPQTIEVDISGLVAVDDTIYARDLRVSSQVTHHGDPNEPLIKIAQTRGSAEISATLSGEPDAAATAQ